jgi:hypothetical protein
MTCCHRLVLTRSPAFRWEGFLWEPRGSQRENYIAIGCTSGIYVSKRTERTEDYCESESSRLSPVLVTNLVARSISEDPGIR